MTPQENHIAYLESELTLQSYHISELEATLMLMLCSQANEVNRDLIYCLASKTLWECQPHNDQTVKKYNEILNECRA